MKSDLRMTIENIIGLAFIPAIIIMSIHYILSRNVSGMIVTLLFYLPAFYFTNTLFKNLMKVKT